MWVGLYGFEVFVIERIVTKLYIFNGNIMKMDLKDWFLKRASAVVLFNIPPF